MAISGIRSALSVGCLLGVCVLLALLASASQGAEGTWVVAKMQDRQKQSPPADRLAGKTVGERLAVTGVRISVGNAVECTKIRMPTGEEVGVSYLAPTIAIGTTVKVSGVVANMTTCLGPVIAVETAEVVGQ